MTEGTEDETEDCEVRGKDDEKSLEEAEETGGKIPRVTASLEDKLRIISPCTGKGFLSEVFGEFALD